MSIVKRTKHSKIRNTGLIFEFLLRQITADVLDKSEKGKAVQILKKRFNERTELGKEFSLYSALVNTNFKSDKKADFLIGEVINKRRTLNNSLLRREKYNLIKDLKETFDIPKLMSSKVKNYKTYASIYKLFEFDTISPEDKTEAYFNIMEHLTTSKEIRLSDAFSHYLPEDEDLRVLSYKILLERFNSKYSKLNHKQKNLLREYINNVSNTNSFKEFVEEEILCVKTELKKNTAKIKDKVTKIKLNEATNSVNKFCRVGNSKVVKDSVIVQLMRYYELIKELKKHE